MQLLADFFKTPIQSFLKLVYYTICMPNAFTNPNYEIYNLNLELVAPHEPRIDEPPVVEKMPTMMQFEHEIVIALAALQAHLQEGIVVKEEIIVVLEGAVCLVISEDDVCRHDDVQNLHQILQSDNAMAIAHATAVHLWALADFEQHGDQRACLRRLRREAREALLVREHVDGELPKPVLRPEMRVHFADFGEDGLAPLMLVADEWPVECQFVENGARQPLDPPQISWKSSLHVGKSLGCFKMF